MPALAAIPARRSPSPNGRQVASPTVVATGTYTTSEAPTLPTSDNVGGPLPTSDILSAIASGQQSLTAIAAANNIPFPRFTLWLLEPETQEQLAALSAAVASATRLAATGALPEVVNSLKRTLAETSTPEPPQRKPLTPIEANDQDGPNRGQVFRLRRQRIALSASWLLLRLARFTPVSMTPRPFRAMEVDGSAASSVRSADRRASLPSQPSCSTPVQPANASATAASASPLPPLEDPREPADFEDAIRCIQQECDLTDAQVAQLRADPESWIREHLPEFLDEPALASAHAAGDG